MNLSEKILEYLTFNGKKTYLYVKMKLIKQETDDETIFNAFVLLLKEHKLETVKIRGKIHFFVSKKYMRKFKLQTLLEII